jgi:hypothetical protein
MNPTANNTNNSNNCAPTKSNSFGKRKYFSNKSKVQQHSKNDERNEKKRIKLQPEHQHKEKASDAFDFNKNHISLTILCELFGIAKNHLRSFTLYHYLTSSCSGQYSLTELTSGINSYISAFPHQHNEYQALYREYVQFLQATIIVPYSHPILPSNAKHKNNNSVEIKEDVNSAVMQRTQSDLVTLYKGNNPETVFEEEKQQEEELRNHKNLDNLDTPTKTPQSSFQVNTNRLYGSGNTATTAVSNASTVFQKPCTIKRSISNILDSVALNQSSPSRKRLNLEGKVARHRRQVSVADSIHRVLIQIVSKTLHQSNSNNLPKHVRSSSSLSNQSLGSSCSCNLCKLSVGERNKNNWSWPYNVRELGGSNQWFSSSSILCSGYRFIREDLSSGGIEDAPFICATELNTQLIYVANHKLWQILYYSIQPQTFQFLFDHCFLFQCTGSSSSSAESLFDTAHSYIQLSGIPALDVYKVYAAGKGKSQQKFSFNNNNNNNSANNSTNNGSKPAASNNLDGNATEKHQKLPRDLSLLSQLALPRSNLLYYMPAAYHRIPTEGNKAKVFHFGLPAHHFLNNFTPTVVNVRYILHCIYNNVKIAVKLKPSSHNDAHLAEEKQEETRIRLPKAARGLIPAVQKILKVHRRLDYKLFFSKAVKFQGKTTNWNEIESGATMAELLQRSLPAKAAFCFIKAVVLKIVPLVLFGTKENRRAFLENCLSFMQLRRFETFTLQQLCSNIKFSDINWPHSVTSNKQKQTNNGNSNNNNNNNNRDNDITEKSGNHEHQHVDMLYTEGKLEENSTNSANNVPSNEKPASTANNSTSSCSSKHQTRRQKRRKQKFAALKRAQAQQSQQESLQANKRQKISAAASSKTAHCAAPKLCAAQFQSNTVDIMIFYRFLLLSLILPLLKYNFYCSETEASKLKIQFFPRPVWNRIVSLQLSQLIGSQFKPISRTDMLHALSTRNLDQNSINYNSPQKFNSAALRSTANNGLLRGTSPQKPQNSANSAQNNGVIVTGNGNSIAGALGVGFIRFYPRNNALRCIVNLSRPTELSSPMRLYFPPVNYALKNAFELLKYELSTALQKGKPNILGSSVFGNKQIYQKFKLFKQKQGDLAGKSSKQRSFYCFHVDIASCFDSLPAAGVLTLISALFRSDSYVAQRYIQLTKQNSSNSGPNQGGTAQQNRLKCTKQLLVYPDNAFSLFFDAICSGNLNNLAANKCSVFHDLVQRFYWSRSAILATLEQHLLHNLVQFGPNFYHQITGIPQGSILSSLLCCAYIGFIENRHILPALDQENALLMRQIDDFFFITTDLAQANKFLPLLQAKLKLFGLKINETKTKSNINSGNIANNGAEASESKNSLQMTRFLSWNGLTLDTENLQFRVDYSRYYDNALIDFLTINYCGSLLDGLKTMMKRSVQAKANLLLLDPALNSSYNIALNIYQMLLFTAMKFYAYIKAVNRLHKNNDHFYRENWKCKHQTQEYKDLAGVLRQFPVLTVQETSLCSCCPSLYFFLIILDCLNYFYSIIQQRFRREKLTFLSTRYQITYLTLTAFKLIICRKQTKFKHLLLLINSFLSIRNNQSLLKDFVALRNAENFKVNDFIQFCSDFSRKRHRRDDSSDSSHSSSHWTETLSILPQLQQDSHAMITRIRF